jgi:hypothetical protein
MRAAGDVSRNRGDKDSLGWLIMCSTACADYEVTI